MPAPHSTNKQNGARTVWQRTSKHVHANGSPPCVQARPWSRVGVCPRHVQDARRPLQLSHPSHQPLLPHGEQPPAPRRQGHQRHPARDCPCPRRTSRWAWPYLEGQGDRHRMRRQAVPRHDPCQAYGKPDLPVRAHDQALLSRPMAQGDILQDLQHAVQLSTVYAVLKHL